jgi:hypothetical protein
MSQYPVNDVLVLTTAVRRVDDDFYRTTAATANFNVYVEYSLESLLSRARYHAPVITRLLPRACYHAPVTTRLGPGHRDMPFSG